MGALLSCVVAWWYMWRFSRKDTSQNNGLASRQTTCRNGRACGVLRAEFLCGSSSWARPNSPFQETGENIRFSPTHLGRLAISTFQKIPLPPAHRHRPQLLMASAPSTTGSTLAPPPRSPLSPARGPRLPATLRLSPAHAASARCCVAPAAPGQQLARPRARVRCCAAVKFIGQSEFAAEVLESDLPVLVDFVADWCGPCRLIAPVVEWASQEYEGRLKIVKIDHDANPQLIEEYKVFGLPTLILFKNGQEVPGSRREGAIIKDKFKQYLEPLLTASTVS